MFIHALVIVRYNWAFLVKHYCFNFNFSEAELRVIQN